MAPYILLHVDYNYDYLTLMFTRILKRVYIYICIYIYISPLIYIELFHNSYIAQDVCVIYHKIVHYIIKKSFLFDSDTESEEFNCERRRHNRNCHRQAEHCAGSPQFVQQNRRYYLQNSTDFLQGTKRLCNEKQKYSERDLYTILVGNITY